MVPLNKELAFQPGDGVPMTGRYRDEAGHPADHHTFDVFGGCARCGEATVWHYTMESPEAFPEVDEPNGAA